MLWLAIGMVFVACVGQVGWNATERLRKVSLADRIERFYAKHAPEDKGKVESLLAKYGRSEASAKTLEDRLRSKYGVPLPEERLSALFAADAVGAAAYVLRFHALPAVAGGVPAWVASSSVGATLLKRATLAVEGRSRGSLLASSCVGWSKRPLRVWSLRQ